MKKFSTSAIALFTLVLFLPASMISGDIDGDRDLDMVATGRNVNDVVWYENAEGMPISWIKHTIDVFASAYGHMT